MLSQFPKQGTPALPRTSPRLPWDGGMAVADAPEANGGFEIAAADLSAPVGELQERLRALKGAVPSAVGHGHPGACQEGSEPGQRPGLQTPAPPVHVLGRGPEAQLCQESSQVAERGKEAWPLSPNALPSPIGPQALTWQLPLAQWGSSREGISKIGVSLNSLPHVPT